LSVGLDAEPTVQIIALTGMSYTPSLPAA